MSIIFGNSINLTALPQNQINKIFIRNYYYYFSRYKWIVEVTDLLKKPCYSFSKKPIQKTGFKNCQLQKTKYN